MKDKHCLYCAMQDTKLDGFGYCIKYDCFTGAGKNDILNSFVKEARDLIFIPKNQTSALGIVSYVTNYYNVRTRKANNIMYRAELEFGYVPQEVLKHIPVENRKDWNANIRW